MRVGIDIDGVLANFIARYQWQVTEVAGDAPILFQPGDNVEPPCWNWPEFRGYDKAVVFEAWKRIKTDLTFWLRLDQTRELHAVLRRWKSLSRLHETYFVTDRPGVLTKQQTEAWLSMYGMTQPTVIVSAAKGLVAKALKLDAYVDDKFENVCDVMVQNPSTRVYLLSKAYNRQTTDASGLVLVPFEDPQTLQRVETVEEFFANIGITADSY